MSAGLKVLRAGPCVSVQDRGRPGFLRDGIAEGGAIDRLALEEGRLLVGNDPGLACLEYAGYGGRFEIAGAPLCLALTGASAPLRLDDKPLQPRCSFSARPGQVIELGMPVDGNYSYLSVAGGIDVTPVLGSRSTHVRGGFGGFEGRCLRKGDLLPVGKTEQSSCGMVLHHPDRSLDAPIRILWSAQRDLFGEKELQLFANTAFVVTSEYDRMGVRLRSRAAPVCVQKGLEALSGVIVAGDIQIPGNGQPVVLLADHQPTGGYPRIATIIAADLDMFAQLPPGSEVRFEPVTEQQAVEALAQLSKRIGRLPERLQKHVADPLAPAELLSTNLISGVTTGSDNSGETQ